METLGDMVRKDARASFGGTDDGMQMLGVRGPEHYTCANYYLAALENIARLERDRAELIQALLELWQICDQELDPGRVPEMTRARALLSRLQKDRT